MGYVVDEDHEYYSLTRFVDYPDLKALLPEKFFHSALYANRHAPDASNYTSSTPSRSNYHSPSSTIKQRTGEMSPLLHQTVHDPDSFLSSTLLLPIPHPTFPLPLIISHQLSLYLTFLQGKQKMESLGSAGYNAMHQLNSDLVRPLPFRYLDCVHCRRVFLNAHTEKFVFVGTSLHCLRAAREGRCSSRLWCASSSRTGSIPVSPLFSTLHFTPLRLDSPLLCLALHSITLRRDTPPPVTSSLTAFVTE